MRGIVASRLRSAFRHHHGTAVEVALLDDLAALRAHVDGVNLSRLVHHHPRVGGLALMSALIRHVPILPGAWVITYIIPFGLASAFLAVDLEAPLIRSVTGLLTGPRVGDCEYRWRMHYCG